MEIVIAILIISLLVATLGYSKKIGFWGTFILSLLTSPIVAILVILFAAEKEPAPRA